MVEETVTVEWIDADTHKYAESDSYKGLDVDKVLRKIKETFPLHNIKIHTHGNTLLESLQNQENVVQLSYDTRIRCKGVYGGNLEYLKDSWNRTLEITRNFGKPPKVINVLKNGSCKARVECYELPKKIEDVTLTDILKVLNKHQSRLRSIKAVRLEDIDFELGRDSTGQGFVEMKFNSPFNDFCNQYEKYSKMFEF